MPFRSRSRSSCFACPELAAAMPKLSMQAAVQVPGQCERVLVSGPGMHTEASVPERCMLERPRTCDDINIDFRGSKHVRDTPLTMAS